MATLPDPSETHQPDRFRVVVRGTSQRDGNVVTLAVAELISVNDRHLGALKQAPWRIKNEVPVLELDTAHMRTYTELDGHRSATIAIIYHLHVPIEGGKTLVIEIRNPSAGALGDDITGPVNVTATFQWLRDPTSD